MYFTNCKTIEDVKKLFRKYAMEFHPDRGGNPEEFKRMYSEYEKAFNRLKNIHRNKNGSEYASPEESAETPEEFADVINAVIGIPGIQIEIIGSWVWITGDTYPHRERIKNAGYHFSRSKKAWYYAAGLKGKKRGHGTLDEHRAKYGTTIINRTTLEIA